MTRLISRCLPAALALAFAACGPSTSSPGGADANPSASCTGAETRCFGAQFQTCVGGSFQTTESCAGTCDPTAGCSDCDPAAGNTCNANNQVVTCNADGSFGTVVETCAGGTSCGGGTCQRSCSADGVDLIYLVDTSNNLLSFDPRMLTAAGGPYHVIGRLNCPNPGTPIDGSLGAATPFSMAVDRGEHDPANNYPMAWVLFNSGKIFKVSTHDASCTATSFAIQQSTPPQTWNLFGMGYVTDVASQDAEKLWIGGGNLDSTSGSIGYVDDNMAAHYVAPMGPSAEYSAELTGLGDATLWAFFPDTVNNAFVQQIDKATGAGVGNKLMFDLAANGRAVQAWAFAQWGGSFYVFVTTVDAILGTDSNAAVHVIDRTTGAHTIPLQNQAYVVVGAGVSTCAPVIIGHEAP